MFQLRKSVLLFCILIFTLSALLLTPLIGESHLNFSEAFRQSDSMSSRILFDVRLPRMVFGFLVGAGLAMIGAVFQAVLRNDLATPYTLGVSSGGALGAVIAIKSGLVFHLLGFSTTSLFAITGSVLTILIIYGIARNPRGISTYTLILAGVTIGLFFSALILFIHYLADYTETYRMVHWLMGALDVSGWHYPIILSVIFVPAFVFFWINVPSFNLLLTGSEMASSKGVNVARLQKSSFFIASLLVGVIVSMAGPIGFIGLIVPHVLRLLIGPDHKWLLPSAVLAGGAFLVWCDTIARNIIAPAELPVGIITAMLGGPFFIFLLIRHRHPG